MASIHNKHWQIGDIRVTRIVEFNAFAFDAEVLLDGASADLVSRHSRWLKPHFATASNQLVMSWQAFVVETPDRKLMVDTCLGTDRKFNFEVLNGLQTSFLEDLQAAGITPESIDTVACTHLHFDHVGWNTRWDGRKFVPTFPNARYLFDNTEYAAMLKLKAEKDWHADHVDIALQPVIEAGLVTFIDAANYKVCEGVWFEPTPGHTPGHVSVHVRSRGQEAIITGDMMHHPLQCAVPEYPDKFDHDMPHACETRRAFVAKYGSSDVLIIGSHFPDPTSGRIVPDGSGYCFEAAENWPAKDSTRKP